MTSSQAGHRALSLPAYSTFIKATGRTGILRLLLLGILLPLVSATADPTATATAPTSVAATVTPTTGSAAASGPQPSVTAGATSTSITQSSSSTPPANSTSPSTSTLSTSQPSNSTGGTSGTNGTTTSNSSSIRCPSFACNHSDCSTMYASQNATPCGVGAFCQLIRQTDMFDVSCSASCVESCVNATHTNCSVNCCASTGCLDGTFANMTTTTTTTVTAETTTTPATTTASASPPTSANNGNKCHRGSCTATATCYEDFRTQPLQTCSSSEPHCQLKRETVNSDLRWTASCTTNCSGEPACKTSTPPPCHLECCNATVASCLFLNGTLNVPSFATRGPYLNTELTASLLCLLAIIFLR